MTLPVIVLNSKRRSELDTEGFIHFPVTTVLAILVEEINLWECFPSPLTKQDMQNTTRNFSVHTED